MHKETLHMSRWLSCARTRHRYVPTVVSSARSMTRSRPVQWRSTDPLHDHWYDGGGLPPAFTCKRIQ